MPSPKPCQHAVHSWSHIPSLQWCGRCGSIRHANPEQSGEWMDWIEPERMDVSIVAEVSSE